jgi:hypothetical protein
VSAIDVTRDCTETSGRETVVHLNNAGAALIPAVVLRTVIERPVDLLSGIVSGTEGDGS